MPHPEQRAPGLCNAKCRLTGTFDRVPDQLSRLLDRLSYHLALHCPVLRHLQLSTLRHPAPPHSWLQKLEGSQRLLGCPAGKQISGDTIAILQTMFRTDAWVILVLEKDAIFQRLCEDRFFDLLPCILITAKGMPDLATRVFLHALHAAFPHLPILGPPAPSSALLCLRPRPKAQRHSKQQARLSHSACCATGLFDYNPSGVTILSVYKFGSARMGLEAPR